MLYHFIIAVGLLIFMLNLFLNLRSLKKPRADGEMPEPASLISVLVPARNEEANIGVCLESLQGQDYPSTYLNILEKV